MRTTVRLNENLLANAKRAAAESGLSLTGLIEDSLRESLGRRKHSAPKRRVRLTTFRGYGLLPGVDLDNTSALLDLMDRHDPS